MASQARQQRRIGRSALAWVLVLFPLSQAMLGLWLQRRHPEMVDPDHQARLSRLESRLAQGKGRPLMLILGSSRAAMAIRPAALGDLGVPGQPVPIVFNFASLGCGPVREWLILRRLLARGIRPTWVVAEVCPLFWPQVGFHAEEPGLLATDVYAADLPVLASLYDLRWPALTHLFEEIATPLVYYRRHVGRQYARCLMPRQKSEWEVGHMGWRDLDVDGWLPAAPRPADWPQFVARQRAGIEPILDGFRIDPHTDRALRGLLEECRAHGIRTAWFVAPDSSPLRSWFPAKARQIFSQHIASLAREYSLSVFDSRDWVPDEGFSDYCHLSTSGAEIYSPRFGHDILRVLLEGQGLEYGQDFARGS